MFREIVHILSVKCNMEEEEVMKAFDEFQIKYPEGEISKEGFLKTMKVILKEKMAKR